MAERALVATGAHVDVILAGQVSQAWVSAPQQATAGGGPFHASVVAAPPPMADARELRRRIETGAYDLLMLNFDPPVRADPEWSDLIGSLGQMGTPRTPGGSGRPVRVVLHATAPSEDYLPLLSDRQYVRNLIAKNNDTLEPEELIPTAAKLLRGDIFGVEKYLCWGAAPLRIAVRESREKHAYVREAALFAVRVGCNDRTVGLVESIADELITNIIYNAPRDAHGRPRYAVLPRRQPVVLEPHKEGALEIACDGTFLAIAGIDPFGSLTQDTIVTYLNRCLVHRAPLLDPSSAGAGMGLYRVFQSLSKFIVNIQPGRRTEVISLIDLRVAMKKFRQMPKSFHIFIDSDSDEVPRG